MNGFPFPPTSNATVIIPSQPAYTFLCPDAAPPSPPSPLEHCKALALFTLAFAIVDLAARPFLKDPNARWFTIHAIANAITAFFSLPDLFRVALSPLCAMVSPIYSWVPSYAASSVHLFHLVFYFFSLRADDIVHHLLFGVCLGVLNFALPWGRVTNHLLFFITGLPGGITYVLLVLVKLNRLKSLREKQWSASLNTWVRAPGLTWFVGVVGACLAHGFNYVPVWASWVCLFLAFTNGTFYGRQALENYVTRRVEKLRQDIVKSHKKGDSVEVTSASE